MRLLLRFRCSTMPPRIPKAGAFKFLFYGLLDPTAKLRGVGAGIPGDAGVAEIEASLPLGYPFEAILPTASAAATALEVAAAGASGTLIAREKYRLIRIPFFSVFNALVISLSDFDFVQQTEELLLHVNRELVF